MNKNAAEVVNHFLNARNKLIGFKTTEDLQIEGILKNEIKYIDDHSELVNNDLSRIYYNVQKFDEYRQDPQSIRNLLISSSSKKEIIKNALNIACNVLCCQTAAIFLISSKDGFLRRAGIQGKDINGNAVDDGWFHEESYEIGESFTGQAAKPSENSRYGETKFSLDFKNELLKNRDKYLEKFGKLKGAIAVPLNGRTKTYGVFRVATDTEFSEQDLLSISFLGGAIAEAISNFHADTESKILKYLNSSLINSSSDNFNYSKFYKTLGLTINSDSIFNAAIMHTKNDDFEDVKERYRFTENESENVLNEVKKAILSDNFVKRAYYSKEVQIVKKINLDAISESVDVKWINERKIKSFASFPLVIPYGKREAVGVLSLFSGQEDGFESDTIIFLRCLTSTLAEILNKEKKNLLIEKSSTRKVNAIPPNKSSYPSLFEDVSFGLILTYIDDLGRYEYGWDGLEGKAPSERAVSESKSFCELLMRENIKPPQVSLATDGEINFFWNILDTIVLDLGFFGDGTYSYYAKCQSGQEIMENHRKYDMILPIKIISLLR